MRTITEQRHDIVTHFEIARNQDVVYELTLLRSGKHSPEAGQAERAARRELQLALDAIDTSLAEVPTLLRERIEMWDRVIGKSTDDDEIRDAQAAQSELRWLLLQLEGEKS
jgi:hypothetical protein